MHVQSNHEYLQAVRLRYRSAPTQQKGLILDEVCHVCDYHRKYAIRLLNAAETPPATRKPAGRPARYHTPQIRSVLQQLTVASNMICSKRLKAMIPLWLPHYPETLDAQTIQLLQTISPATIDRLLQDWRHRHGKIGLATTKPGSLLRRQIPIKTEQWDQTRPGYLEADTVAHCGTSTISTTTSHSGSALSTTRAVVPTRTTTTRTSNRRTGRTSDSASAISASTPRSSSR